MMVLLKNDGEAWPVWSASPPPGRQAGELRAAPGQTSLTQPIHSFHHNDDDNDEDEEEVKRMMMMMLVNSRSWPWAPTLSLTTEPIHSDDLMKWVDISTLTKRVSIVKWLKHTIIWLLPSQLQTMLFNQPIHSFHHIVIASYYCHKVVVVPFYQMVSLFSHNWHGRLWLVVPLKMIMK